MTVPEEPPLVALTFDDGPRTSTTSRLLDGLALREIQATFFLVGDRIQGQEALVRRMAEDGHQIGVHSYDHSCISDLSRADFDLQVGRTRGVLSAVLGSGDFWLRPPYGIIDDAGLRWAGSPVVLWSVDPEDWKANKPMGISSRSLPPWWWPEMTSASDSAISPDWIRETAITIRITCTMKEAKSVPRRAGPRCRPTKLNMKEPVTKLAIDTMDFSQLSLSSLGREAAPRPRTTVFPVIIFNISIMVMG